MAEEKEKTAKKTTKTKTTNPLIGAQTQPTVLDKTTKIDIDIEKTLVDNIVQGSINGGLNISKIEEFTSISNARDQIYQLIDTMAEDSSVAAILKTYAEEVCETGDNGHIMWCESNDSKVSMFVNYLLNVMNVDKNIYRWVYCLLKYGDVYLKLFRESDYEDKLFKKENIDNAEYSIRTKLNEEKEKVDESVKLSYHKNSDLYSYYVEMVADPSTMFELTKYGKTFGYIETPNREYGLNYLNNYLGTNQTQNNGTFNFRMKSNDVIVHQADDYVHACLDDIFTRFPETVDLFFNDADYDSNKLENAQSYSVKRGKSLLYDSYKVWREKTLLEQAILLNRLTKSSLIRNIQVEVGDMPKTQVQQTLRRVKELFEQKTALDTNTGMIEYPNPGPIENNIFTATHNGQGAISVTPVGGDVNVKDLTDLDNWVNKFYAAYGIPKAYYGYVDDGAGFNGGTSLSILSSVFAKSVIRVQNAIIQAITDAINFFLLNRGCKTYINNYVLKMKKPLTQEEISYRENLTSRVNAISNIQSLMSDVESRARRLEILKSLVATLNYGDDLVALLQQEVDAAEKAEKAQKQEETEEESSTNDETETQQEEIDLGDLENLGNSSEVPMESFAPNPNATPLVEETDLSENDFLKESDTLPTPEQATDKIDFTKNK